jgi:hypothetical protein
LVAHIVSFLLALLALLCCLDIDFGDPVTPAPQLLQLPSLRIGHPAVPILGYPIETVLAEKISTAIALGKAKTRVRDYADVNTLTGTYPLSSAAVHAALKATAEYRHAMLAPLSRVTGALPMTRQPAYHAFRRWPGADGHTYRKR